MSIVILKSHSKSFFNRAVLWFVFCIYLGGHVRPAEGRKRVRHCKVNRGSFNYEALYLSMSIHYCHWWRFSFVFQRNILTTIESTFSDYCSISGRVFEGGGGDLGQTSIYFFVFKPTTVINFFFLIIWRQCTTIAVTLTNFLMQYCIHSTPLGRILTFWNQPPLSAPW